MNHHSYVKQIAAAYGVSRQRIYQCMDLFNLQPEDWKRPDYIFTALLDAGNTGGMRTRLVDPAFRATVTAKLQYL